MDSRNAGWLLLLIKNPFSLVAVAVVALIGFVLMAFLGMTVFIGGSSSSGDGFSPIACQVGDMNMEVWEDQFVNAGAFTGKSDDFLLMAEKNQIDPVLLASIAFHETGRGKSKMVRERNNPGGLYNSNTNSFFVYDSLEEGIDAMASNLYRLYISQGLFTVEQIGAKYAPIGVDNDPNNLNIHWVPNVNNMVAQFGGLTANCELMGFSGEWASPLANWNVTSHFGTRVHPISGEVHNHNGTDFACSTGDPVMAVTSGIVTQSTFHNGWGQYVKVDHGDNATQYAHMSKRAVSVGEQVNQGTVLGYCGSTGESTGPHLHLELWIGPKRIDPYPYFGMGGSE